jgi:purine catabolism regulator
MRDVLPPDARLLAGAGRLRNRVAWPVLARSTGLGEIEGGELVLVPAARAQEVMSRLRDLAAGGIAGVVLAGCAPGQERIDVDLPVIAVERGIDLRQLEANIERYVARRRRDLFALDQELHRTLVDGAIGGAGLAELTALAARRAGRQIVVDRDGEVLRGLQSQPVPEDVIERARAALRDRDSVPVLVPGAPGALAAPITTGREHHGIALVVGGPDELTDDDEVILVSLASAAAIILGREPDIVPESLPSMLLALGGLRDAETRLWLALAVTDGAQGSRRLRRAVRAELSAREIGAQAAADGETLIVLLPESDSALAGSVIRALRSRTGSSTLRAGVGRARPGSGGARRSAEQALAALARAGPGESTGYDAIEIDVLLSNEPGWSEFAAGQIGPLQGTRPDERELLHSLRAYLACGRNAKAAARKLQVHRNTLQYRLRRIETLLDRSLDDPDVLFLLELACRILDAQENRR